MCRTWGVLYNVALRLLLWGVELITPLFPKLQARKRLLSEQQQTIHVLSRQTTTLTIWFHAASMGELEQIKPLVRIYREQMPNARLVVSVFSPSAFRHHTDLPCDALLLLPYDTPRAIEHWLLAIRPQRAIVSRYDLWWNITVQLSRHNVQLIVVNATFPSSRWTRLLKGYYRCLYNRATLVIARSERHATAFAKLGVRSTVVTCPDTRIDQLVEHAKNAATPPPFLQKDAFRLLLGSTWPDDESLWARAWNKLDGATRRAIQLVIVPHEPSPRHSRRLCAMFPKAVLLSQLSENTQPAIVVVDRIGLLATLYHNVSAAYIGGGFGAGVHSVLEAAFAGIPIACGPRIERSEDALELHAAGSLRILSSAADAVTWTEDVTRDSSHAEIAQSVQRYLHSLRGVSRQVFALIEQQQSPAT